VTNPAPSDPSRIRVVVGEDSFLVREGIARILEELDGVELLATTADVDELRASVDDTNPDVVITDIRMPPTNTDEGIRFADELRSTHPEIGVVILSQHAEPRYAMSLLKSGAHQRAYLLKERLTDEEELVRALQEVAAGRSLIDSRVVDRLVNARERQDATLASLTPRELEILGLIAQGRSNAWIATSLTITKRAVERHINAIFMKLDLGPPDDVNRRVKAALVYLSGDGISD
jgi:DNA-binding NarL/FixJ family response regulator